MLFGFLLLYLLNHVSSDIASLSSLVEEKQDWPRKRWNLNLIFSKITKFQLQKRDKFFPFSIFSLRTATRLNCDGRFYRGYNMKLGDTGTILSSQTQDSTRLCLFKFYPSNNCKIRFSCDTFVVSSGYNSGSCPSKVIQSFLCTGGRKAHFQSQSERQGCI